MTNPQYSGTISLGNILIIASLVIGLSTNAAVIAYGYGGLATKIEGQGERIVRIEASQQDRESRLRTVEASIAGQAADLRAIAAGIADIKQSLKEDHK